MAKSCPDCGGEVEYASRSVELLEGTCAACGHAVLLVPPAGSAEGSRAVGAASHVTGGCWECGGVLAFSVHPDRSVEATCAQCHTISHLAPAIATAEDQEEEDEEDDDEASARPPRFRDAGGDRPPPRRGPNFARAPRWESRDGERPAARPCRQCGGPLEFSQNEDGTMTGACASCGNRFTMRPRPYGDRPQRGGGRPSWGGGGGGGRGRPFQRDRRGPWQDRGGGGGPPDRRRRRRDSDE
ncbi:MAG: hypothetical protein L3J97_07850 [Thermoplasmata archaeon]|nr:hypothetical protein [Thermoplasmata archaeon]